MSRDPKEVAAIDPALRNVIAHIELSTMQVELLKMILTNTYLQGLKDGVALAMEPSHAQADHGKYESCLDSRYPNGNPCADIRGEDRLHEREDEDNDEF